MTTDALRAAQLRKDKAEYLAFLDKRIPELYEQGKPPPEYDEKGRIKPGRSGDYPGRKARTQADREWAAQQR